MDYLGRLVAVLRTLIVASLMAGGATRPALTQTDREEADWIATRADGSTPRLRTVPERYPLGRHASEAFVAVARMSVQPDWTPAPDEPGPPSAGHSIATAGRQVADVY